MAQYPVSEPYPQGYGSFGALDGLSGRDRARMAEYLGMMARQSMAGGALPQSPVIGNMPSSNGPVPSLSYAMPQAPTGAPPPSLRDALVGEAPPSGQPAYAPNPKLGDLVDAAKAWYMANTPGGQRTQAAMPSQQPGALPSVTPSAPPASLNYAMPAPSSAPLPADLQDAAPPTQAFTGPNARPPFGPASLGWTANPGPDLGAMAAVATPRPMAPPPGRGATTAPTPGRDMSPAIDNLLSALPGGAPSTSEATSPAIPERKVLVGGQLLDKKLAPPVVPEFNPNDPSLQGNPWKALLQFGLGMMQAGSKPGATILGAAGEGGLAAMKEHSADQVRAQQLALQKFQAEMSGAGITNAHNTAQANWEKGLATAKSTEDHQKIVERMALEEAARKQEMHPYEVERVKGLTDYYRSAHGGSVAADGTPEPMTEYQRGRLSNDWIGRSTYRLKTLQSALDKEIDPQKKAGIVAAMAQVQSEKNPYAPAAKGPTAGPAPTVIQVDANGNFTMPGVAR